MALKSFRIPRVTWERFSTVARRERRKPAELVRILIEDRIASGNKRVAA